MKRLARLTIIFFVLVTAFCTFAFADIEPGSNSVIPVYHVPTQKDLGASGDTEEYYLIKSTSYMKGEYVGESSFRYEFDDNGNITARYRAFNDTYNLDKSFEYNEAGQIVKESRNQYDWISYEYDENGNLLVKQEGPHEQMKTTYEYDENGNLVKYITSVGTFVCTVDEFGRVIKESSEIGRTEFEYGAFEDFTRASNYDADNNLMYEEIRIYDQFGHWVEEKLYSGGELLFHYFYEYDSNGNLTYARQDSYDLVPSGSGLQMERGEWTEKIYECYFEYEKLQTKTSGFTDVTDKSSYYYDAVVWAVKNSITKGTSDTTFSPNDDCSRGQVVTFLWRAAGSPEPETTVCPFTDIKEDAFYYKAVLWAAENGITLGTGANKFSPDDTVSRSQFVTFLWRFAGEPEISAENPFDDIKEGFYYDAVLWAVDQGITKGTGATTFAPLKTCSRAETVTFLYRYDKTQ